MLIVHQMTKVASHAWYRAAQKALACDDTQIIHCHYITPSSRKHIADAFNAPPGFQTFSNMIMPNAILRRGAAAWERLLAAREANEFVQVISGVRDPVARSISIIIFMADFYGNTEQPLNPRVTITPEYVIEYLRENWRQVLDGEAPQGTFNWLLWYLTGAYRTWFTEELGAAFGVDVLQTDFELNQASQRITTSAADIFIYRVEDMQPLAPGYTALLRQASAYLGVPVPSVPAFNTSSTRRSREISAAVRKRFCLPFDMLDAIYGDAVIRHFYGDDEITEFVARWRE